MGCAMFGSDQADIKEINADFRRDKRTSKIDCRRRSTKSNDKIIQNVTIVENYLSEEDSRYVKQILTNHDLFGTLESEQTQEIVKKMIKVKTSVNQYVFKENDQGSCFFIIEKGQVDIEINNLKIKTLKKGDSFGQLALLYLTSRSASVKVKSQATFFLLKSNAFKSVLVKINQRNHQIAESIIKKVQIFYALNNKQKYSIVKYFRRIKLAEGQDLFKKGDPAKELYIIEKGKVSLTFNDGNKKDIQIGQFESFGESSLKDQTFRQGTATALTPLVCFYIDKDSLQKCLGDTINNIIFQNIKKWALKSSPIFCNLSNTELQKLAGEFKTKYAKKGEIIMDEGKQIESVFICLEGKINSKRPGEIFYDEFIFRQKTKLDKWLLKNDEGSYAELSFTRIQQILEVFQEKKQGTKQEIKKQARRSTFVQNQQPFLNFKNFDFKTKLGEGQFGQVYLVNDRKLGLLYALKCIEKKAIIEEGMQQSVISERQILSMVNHPFIVGYYKAYQDQRNIYLLLEYINGLQMYYALRQIGILSKNISRYYFGSILLAIEYLHSLNIVYRDIKPENCIVNFQGKAFLIDLGTAKMLKKQKGFRTETIIGTPHYLAPEVMQGKGYSFEVDLWSLGVFFYELVSGRLPFAQNLDSPYDIYVQVMKTKVNFPKFVKDENEKIIISNLLQKQPLTRIQKGKLDKIKKSKYFDGFLWKDLAEGKISGPYIPRRFRNKKQKYFDIQGFPLIDYMKSNFDYPDRPKIEDWTENTVK